MKTRNIEYIFLYDDGIIDWHLHPFNELRAHLLSESQSSTRILKERGYDSFDKEIGNYRVNASASVYLAEIVRVDFSHMLSRRGRTTNPSKEILFEGGISIHQIHQRKKRKKQSSHLLTKELKFAKFPYSEASKNTLYNHIFPDNRKKEEIIKAIIAGYESQEEFTLKSSILATIRTFKTGRFAGEVESQINIL